MEVLEVRAMCSFGMISELHKLITDPLFSLIEATEKFQIFGLGLLICLRYVTSCT